MTAGGCAQSAKWRSNYHDSPDRQNQDAAHCRMIASQSYYNNNYTSSSGPVTTTTLEGHSDRRGNFSGTATTTQQEHWGVAITDSVVKGMQSDAVFSDCMQAKGYFLSKDKHKASAKTEPPSSGTKSLSGGNKVRSGLWEKCYDSADCELGMYCNEGMCRIRPGAPRQW